MTFEEAVAALAAFGPRGWRLGLDRMQEYLRLLELDEFVWGAKRPAYIHIAGTNGKGSTTAFVQSLLVEQGYSVGAAYSPYVYNVRERAQFNRSLISEADFAVITERLIRVGELLEPTEMRGPTEFEIKTALGFAYWHQMNCDAVALEVGLGGRLDATNVVEPAASIIVSIGLDHMKFLGETLPEIAREKAGIIKPGRPVIVGDMAPSAREVVVRIAAEKGSEVWLYGKDVVFEGGTVRTPKSVFKEIVPGIRGAKQAHNCALAIAALDAAGLIRETEAVTTGASRAWVPGRFQQEEREGQTWILDGAHNAAAAEVLSASLLQAGFTDMTLVTGMLEGHDGREFAKILAPHVKQVICTPIDFFRTKTAEETAESWKEQGFVPMLATDSSEAIELAQKSKLPVLVTGSFYLVGEVGRALKFDRQGQ